MRPQPEFGKPETGTVRHWFRTDAQMRRHYMDPETRELERQRISARRAQMKKHRLEAAEFQRRAAHAHTLCIECVAGLVDIGALTGKRSDPRETDRHTVPCCSCLALLPAPRSGRSRGLELGPHYDRLRCRVLDPDPEVLEVDER